MIQFLVFSKNRLPLLFIDRRMNLKPFRSLLILLLTIAGLSTFSQSLILLTYNIRYNNPSDGINAWSERKNWLCEQIHKASPGIFGIQEGLIQQVEFIDSSFPDYGRIGVGREDGKTGGEFCAVYYNRNAVRLIRSGTFWLSDSPRKPSKGWDAACFRICTWGLFKEHRSGKKFWVLNTHFDHMGSTARRNSALMILERLKEMNKQGFPVMLMGDLNTESGSEPVKILSTIFQDSRTVDQQLPMDPEGTFNGFKTDIPATERIDYIFTAYGAKAVNYRVEREMREGRYASDHFPVVVTVSL